LGEVADAAVRVFTAKGFRAAGISDVAGELGLSHGAVYTYADSKQALLHLALLRVLEPEAVAGLAIPVVAPPNERAVDVVKRWAAGQSGLGGIEGAAQVPVDSTAVAREELAEVVDGLYSFIEEHRVALKLVESCSADLPELAAGYFVETRRGLLDVLGDYLRVRIEAGVLRAVPDVPVAARFVVETVAWFAMHRHDDPDSAMLSDDDCRRGVRDLVAASFALER
jgi:AcrR family transcriptional regulator